MWSTLKFITAKNSYIPKEWFHNPSAAFKQAPMMCKLTFLMQQSVIINYLERAYGTFSPNSSGTYDTGILYLITIYKEDLIIPLVDEIKSRMDQLDNRKVVDAVIEQIDILLNRASFQLDADLCFSFIESNEEELPRAFEISDTSFYRPYLLFVESSHNAGSLVDIKGSSSTKTVKVDGPVTIPSFGLSADDLLVVSYEQKFSSYSYDIHASVELDKALNIGPSSILTYLYGYDWSSWTFNGLLGILASMCLELDANVIPQSSLMWLYYFLYRKVFGWSPHARTRSNSLGMSPNIITARRCVLTLITAIRKRYHVQLDDTELLSDLLYDSRDKDVNADNLHKYLNAKDAASVSVEMYTAFKRSMLGTFEELDFKKTKKQSLDRIMALRARSDKEVSANLGEVNDVSALEPYLRDRTFSLEAVLGKVGGRTNMVKNAAGDSDDDVDAGQGADESFDEDEAAKPDSPDSDDSNPDSDPATMPGGDTEEMEDEHTHTQDPLPSVSDKRGIKLELGPNENTDTVLYRFELKAYVDALLANPPKYLDVQTVTYLKRLKAFWWNCLSVQTLYDVLNSMVKVPKDYRIKKVKA